MSRISEDPSLPVADQSLPEIPSLPEDASPEVSLPAPAAGEAVPDAGAADPHAPPPGINPVSPVFALVFFMTALSTGSWHTGLLVFATGMLLALRRKLGVSLGILFFLSLFPVGYGVSYIVTKVISSSMILKSFINGMHDRTDLVYLLIIFYAVLAGLAYAFLLWAASRLTEEKNRQLVFFDYFWLGMVAAGAGLRFLF